MHTSFQSLTSFKNLIGFNFSRSTCLPRLIESLAHKVFISDRHSFGFCHLKGLLILIQKCMFCFFLLMFIHPDCFGAANLEWRNKIRKLKQDFYLQHRQTRQKHSAKYFNIAICIIFDTYVSETSILSTLSILSLKTCSISPDTCILLLQTVEGLFWLFQNGCCH